jgi:hypothetical protein
VQRAGVKIMQYELRKQQEPVPGTWQVFGTQTPSGVQVLVTAQSACVVTVQLPPRVQQEPVDGAGSAQVVALHGMSAPSHTSGDMQSACVVIVQAGIPTAVLQQAPVGGAHTFGTQVPNIVHVPVQAVCSVTVQSPFGAQQAPVGSPHMFGTQVPNIVHVPAQAACSVTVQSPFGAQQAPVGSPHTFGTQVPNIVHVPAQAACSVTVQSPFGAQQAPAGCTHTVVAQLLR